MAPSLQYGPPPQFAQLPAASTRNYLASPCHVDLRYAPITATGRSNRPKSLITAGPPKLGWSNNGKEDGPWVIYHHNGQLMSKGTYKDGKKNGSWVGYNNDGTVVEEETGTFKDGKKVK